MQKRVAFAQTNERSSWNTVMFSDAKSFQFASPGSKVVPVRYLKADERGALHKRSHANKYTIHAGLTPHGMTPHQPLMPQVSDIHPRMAIVTFNMQPDGS